jgi:hypothetical protein
MRSRTPVWMLCCIALVALPWAAVATPLDGDTVDYRMAQEAGAAIGPDDETAAATAAGEDELAAADVAGLAPGDGPRIDSAAWIAAGGRCGTVEFGPPHLPRAPRKDEPVAIEAAVSIPVVFHVIYKETTVNGTLVRTGYVSTTRLENQIKVLNAAYAGSGITFTLRSIDRVKNSTWFAMSMGSPAEQTAKAALAVDPAHVLNIYTAGPANNVLGWAYFPWSYAENHVMHGLVLLHSTLPGGSAKPYNLGDTATHELGHYLGLFHTFQGGCKAPGDYVSDTFDEATPAYGCPQLRDTCPTPGLDPVWNFMDYTDDACMTGFTSGQSARLRWALATYKRGLTSAVTLTASPAAPAAVEVAPNPFNPTTVLSFRLEEPAHVSLRIYDVAGREVATLADEERAAGEHRVVFEGRRLAGGVYFAVLDAGAVRARERLVLLK